MKRLIWDWNGTLFDDVQIGLSSINALLHKYGLHRLSLEEYRNVFEFPVKNYYRKIGFDFRQTPFEQLAKEYMDYYQPNSVHCQLRNEAMDALKLAKEKGMAQCILSASEKTNLMDQLRRFSLDPYIDEIYAIDDMYAYGKEHLAQQIPANHPRDELWMIGDSLHDGQVAREIRAHCLFVSQGHQNVQENPYCVPVLDDLLACVEEIYERD
ncbi:MAG: HAD family hydrolase [Erysipelotrichaceae bacterium]|nr:HAD family hydrolase [Erysipelotrichaceae bacterium]